MSQKLNDAAAVDLTGKIMVVAIIVLFLVVAFFFFLHLYAKWFWYRRDQDGAPRRRRRLDFNPGHQELAAVTTFRKGLDPSVLKSLLVVKFNPKDFKDGLECSVCLSEVLDGENARLLPKCNHGFHVECIDMWFQSHSTCPLCRNPVSNQSSTTSPESPPPPPAEESTASVSGTNFPTNVLFWGNETQVSTLGLRTSEGGHRQGPTSSQPSSSNRADGMLVIDIPRQSNEEEEDQKSPTPTPTPTRLRSLKMLLSRDRWINPSSSSNVEVEQAGWA